MNVYLRNVSVRGMDVFLRGVNLFAGPDQVVGLLGDATGSALLRTVQGLRVPFVGAVLLNGEDRTGLSADALRALGVRSVPTRLAAAMTVRELLCASAGSDGTPAVVCAERIAAVLSWLPRLGPMLDRPTAALGDDDLSVARVADALVSRPRVLLATDLSLDARRHTYAELLAAMGHAGRTHGLTTLLAEPGTAPPVVPEPPADASQYDLLFQVFDGQLRAISDARRHDTRPT